MANVAASLQPDHLEGGEMIPPTNKPHQRALGSSERSCLNTVERNENAPCQLLATSMHTGTHAVRKDHDETRYFIS